MRWAGPAEEVASICKETAPEGAGEEQAPESAGEEQALEGARVARNWTGAARRKVS